jgi:hypothetical protein
MICLAKYPNGFILNQTHLPYYTSWLTAGGSKPQNFQPSDKNYLRAIDHYINVLLWCKNTFIGPYNLDEQDILYYGIRVRIGSLQDQFLFTLKWG